MDILAIDPATITGWAHSCGDSGIWDLTLKKDESVGIKFLKLRKHLEEIRLVCKINLVAMEVPRGFGYHNALVAHSKFCGVIEEFCADPPIMLKGYSSTAIKKHATGNGRADKKRMVLTARMAFDVDIIDDNHADALWILDLAQKDFETQK